MYHSGSNSLKTAISLLGVGLGAKGLMSNEGTKAAIGVTTMSSINSVSGLKSASSNNIGNLNGTTALMNNQKPYLIIEKPNQSVPKNYAEELGFPLNVSGKLNEFRGFTVLEKIDVHNVNCTDEEKLELERLLKEGVIL